MSVRAKMICSEKSMRTLSWKQQPDCIVKLQPVSGDENKPWSQYTPSGSVELTITNPAAFEAFVPGQHYFVDFSPTEEKSSGAQ